ncbi:hypothetical protein LDENG_00257680 [Lucifuga dentata]|nr:hypothetical protein LDENG_00257680 [Lucifuga dentata]
MKMAVPSTCRRTCQQFIRRRDRATRLFVSMYPVLVCVCVCVCESEQTPQHVFPHLSSYSNYNPVKGPYHPFSMFEPNIFSFHTCYVTDNHFPKDKTIFQLS